MKPAQLAAIARNQQRITTWLPTFAAMQAGGEPRPPQIPMPQAPASMPMAAPMPAPRETNPAPPQSISYVDLDALVIVNAEDPSLNGAELVDVVPTEDRGLVSATYKNPATGYATTEILPVLHDAPDDPWWKREGHCCESCALGHDCDGDNCSLEERSSNPSPPMPVITRRRSGIFSRR